MRARSRAEALNGPLWPASWARLLGPAFPALLREGCLVILPTEAPGAQEPAPVPDVSWREGQVSAPASGGKAQRTVPWATVPLRGGVTQIDGLRTKPCPGMPHPFLPREAHTGCPSCLAGHQDLCQAVLLGAGEGCVHRLGLGETPALWGQQGSRTAGAKGSQSSAGLEPTLLLAGPGVGTGPPATYLCLLHSPRQSPCHLPVSQKTQRHCTGPERAEDSHISGQPMVSTDHSHLSAWDSLVLGRVWTPQQLKASTGNGSDRKGPTMH